MQKIGIGLAVLTVLTFLLSGAYVAPVNPVQPATEQRSAELALRQIVHELFVQQGDLSSTIPPVRKMADGRFLVETNCFIDYDSLISVGPEVLERAQIANEYTLALEDCNSAAIVLGFRSTEWRNNGTPACVGRDQEGPCYNISLQLIEAPVVPADQRPAIAGIFILGLLLSAFFWRSGQKGNSINEEEADQVADKSTEIHEIVNGAPGVIPAEKGACQLSSITSVNEVEQTISVGQYSETLTHRELKLLMFLHEHMNKVLEREQINAAVWGSEGLIVGRSLDVFISRLRKKIAADPELKIMTVHGIGYKLVRGLT